MARDVPIAIVGMACRFPGALDTPTYWDNILRDVCAIAPMPPERFHRERYFNPELGAYGKSYCDLGGLVEERPFDARAFRMPPKVVAATDVAHLWALEVARATLEDAGYDPFALEQKNVGVMIGHARGSMMTADIAFSTAVEEMVESLADAPALAALGLDRLSDLSRDVIARVHSQYPHRTEDGSIGSMTSALAGLIASSFGLTGRHMVVDAACASSFAAMDLAVGALSEGRLDAAIVGGASYSQELSVIMFAQSRALSPDGSFPFDRRANGFISSDGFGLFLLRRLDDALRDGNRIRAVIRGVGGSCDGKGKALWAPRKEGQVLAMQRAYVGTGVDPASIGLIEAHATSTPLGDRTEVEALHEIWSELRGGRPLPVGSVKGNIGHTREAAGAASLMKAVLALEHGTLPPTGNLRDPSAEIPWSELSVEPLRAPRPWTANGPRRAGVNAFGIGGLNYHVVVEEAPPERKSFAVPNGPALTASPRGAPRRSDIAIVGIGARLPGAFSASAFFEKLLEAADLTTDVPPDRWSKEIYHQVGDRAPYRTYLARGAFVEGFEADWRRYRVPPKLIERNDPLQFMLLESALDALTDAGVDPEVIDRQRVAVLVGTVFGSDYALNLSLAIRAQELAETVAEASGRPGDGALIEQVLEALRGRLPSINEDSSGSFSSSTLASRTAKTLDFMGPAFAVDAACASSLASLEAACGMLRAGQVDYALYGGGDRAMRVQRYEAYCQFYALSRSGTPRPFDERADGFLPGEGAAMCLLERLEDAERNGHHIYAIIRGIGSSSDGERKSLYKPSTTGLSRAMMRALGEARIDPRSVGYVECHGGATPLGDATEAAAVRATYGAHRTTPLPIGSVKSNVGHTQGAAGIAAVVKTAMAMDRKRLPPTRGFERPHPDHGFGEALRVNREAEPFTARAAAVSSMGLAGINYHVVLEAPGTPEAPRTAEAVAPSAAFQSASTPSPGADYPQPSLHNAAESGTPSGSGGAVQPRLHSAAGSGAPSGSAGASAAGSGKPSGSAGAMRPHQGVVRISAASEVALTAAIAQSSAGALHETRAVGQGPWVASIAAIDVADVERALGTLRKVGCGAATRELREKAGIFVRGRAAPAKVALSFSGQGSQYPGMMRALVDALPAAKRVLQRLDDWLTARAQPTLSATLFSGAPIPADVFLVQACVLVGDLVGLEAARAAGVVPSAVTGHSYGDYAALVAAGVWSAEDALAATRLRADAIVASAGRGAMTSVAASRGETEALVAEARASGHVELANLNAPDQTVVAGALEALAALETLAARRGIETQRLAVPGPFHSALMEPARARLATGLAGFSLATPRVPYLCSVTGAWETDPERIRSALVDQLTRPVDFVGQVRRLIADGYGLIVECGPKGVLTSLAKRIRDDADLDAVPVDDPQRAGPWSLARLAAVLDARAHAGRGEELSQSQLHISRDQMNEPDDKTASVAAPSTLPLIEGEVADRWLAEEGFDAFWEKTRPSLITLVESLWTTEKRLSRPPEEAQVEARVSAELLEGNEPSAHVPDRQQVEQFLLRAMCEESGYPPDIIELDADLEADLGIDTVKQAQVLGKVRDQFDIRTDEKLSLRDFPTLRHVLDYVDQQLQPQREGARERPRRSRVPMLDLTARRSPEGPLPTPPPASEPPRAAERSSRTESPAPSSPDRAPVMTAASAVRSSSAGPARVAAPEHSTRPTLSAQGSATPLPAPAASVPRATSASASGAPSSERSDGAAMFAMPAPSSTLPSGAARPLTVLHLSGTSREIGRQHGEALRDPILEVMHRYQEFLGAQGNALLELPDATLRLRSVFDADSREELVGIAEAVGVPELYLLAYNLDAALFPSLTGGCVQAIRLGRHNDGTLIHMVNEDSPLLLHLGGVYPRVVQVRRRTDGPDPARRVVFFSLAGQLAGPNGVADNGLTITSTTLLDGPEPVGLPTGLPHPLLVKQTLESARSLDDAMNHVRHAARAGRWSLLVSAAEADRAHYLEYDGDRVVRDEAIDAGRSTANHALGGPAEAGEVPDHSCHRAARAAQLLADAHPLTVDRAKAILRDRHDLARGRDVAHATMNTVRRVDNVMSLVVEPGFRRVHVTDRVQPPGTSELDGAQFVTISYGAPPPPTARVTQRGSDVSGRGAPNLSGSSVIDAPVRSGESDVSARHAAETARSQANDATLRASSAALDSSADGSRDRRNENTIARAPSSSGAQGLRDTAGSGRPQDQDGGPSGSAEARAMQSRGAAGNSFEAPVKVDAASTSERAPREAMSPRGDERDPRSPVLGQGAETTPRPRDSRVLGSSQGPSSAPPSLERVSAFTGDGAGIEDVPEVMRRHVIRVIEESRREPERSFSPSRVLLAGEGPFASALAERLRARGAEVTVSATCADAEQTLAQRGGAEAFDAVGIVLPSAPSQPETLAPDAWRTRAHAVLASPFSLLRAYAPHRPQGTVFGVSFLGGGLGFENAAQGSGDHGGLLGLLKAVRREHAGLRVQALDASPSESPSLVADALLAELDAGSPRLEVGLLRGKRVRLVMAERDTPRGASAGPLPRAWLVTGGARGVTARLCLRLAELYQPALHVFGRQALPGEAEREQLRALNAEGLEAFKQSMLAEMRGSGRPFSPLDWRTRCEALDKTLEIDANLRALSERGSDVTYHAIDIADRDALARALEEVRRAHAIEGILHGAGVEVAKPFDKKTDALYADTVRGKVDGLVHLLALTEKDPIRQIVGFSSVSGRFGGHGQTDYSLANEAEARILSAHRARRPERRVAAISWPAFSEVGLAARSSARVFLERSGQAFMSPSEGANHLVRELWADLPEPEVTVCERLEALDLDRLLVPEAERAAFRVLDARAASQPLIDHLVLSSESRTTVERRIDAREPFLDQHRMGPQPILPAVISLEMMAELAGLEGGAWSLADVKIERPLKLSDPGSALISIEREGDALSVRASIAKADGVVLEPHRVFVRGQRVSAAPPGRLFVSPPDDSEVIGYPYPKTWDRTAGSRLIFHGPVLRSVETVRAAEHGGVATLVVPSTASLVPGSPAERWRIPAALLDGCLQATGLLARMLYEAVALPAGFGRVDVAARAHSAAGERVTLHVRFRSRDEDRIVSDFSVMSADGPLLSVEGYVAQVVPLT